MSFSREKKFFSYLWNFLKFLFTCVKLMITVVSYVIRFCSWLTVAASKEKTYLYKKFTTSVGSSDRRPDLEFSRIEEDRYSAMGYAIELKDWEAYVDQLHFIYKLSPEVGATLKLAKYEHRQASVSSHFNFDESSGEGNYLKLLVENKDDKINFVFAGNRVNFQIAPIKEVSIHTIEVGWLFSWSGKTVDLQPRYLTIEEKQEMENYFTARAVNHFVSQNGRKALEYEQEYNS